MLVEAKIKKAMQKYRFRQSAIRQIPSALIGFVALLCLALSSLAQAQAPIQAPIEEPITNVRFDRESAALSACFVRELYANKGMPRPDRMPELAPWVRERDPSSLRSLFCVTRAQFDAMDCYNVFLLSLDPGGWREEGTAFVANSMYAKATLAIPVFRATLGNVSLSGCRAELGAAIPAVQQ